MGASEFYLDVSADLGQDFLDELQRIIDLLRRQPELGRLVSRGLRALPLHRFPFSVIYASEPDRIVIVAVAHQNRRPGYWRGRSRNNPG